MDFHFDCVDEDGLFADLRPLIDAGTIQVQTYEPHGPAGGNAYIHLFTEDKAAAKAIVNAYWN